MAFKKMVQALPPRKWALVGFPGDGKSIFASRMKTPSLVIDADGKFYEALKVADGDIFTLSDDQSDHFNPDRIKVILAKDMPGSGIKTILFDSLTPIIEGSITAAMRANAAGKSTNKIAAFADKASIMNTLVTSVSQYGTDVLWIYHLSNGVNSRGEKAVTTSVTITEIARMQAYINARLEIVRGDNGERGIKIEWAQYGRSGMVLWDEPGAKWEGMPERLEVAMYVGLSTGEMEAIATSDPTSFANPAAAVAWGFSKGGFRDAVHAQNAYDKVKSEKSPKAAAAMWAFWIEEVNARLQNKEEVESEVSGEK